MNDFLNDPFERKLLDTARHLSYPVTPNIVSDIRDRLSREEHYPAKPTVFRNRLRPVGIILALFVTIFAILLAVPQVRAALLDYLQIGAVRIILPTTTSTPLPPSETPLLPEVLMPSTATPEIPIVQVPVTATPKGLNATPSALPPTSTSTVLAQSALLDLAGETTLSEARNLLKFPLLLPSYPPGLGAPDKVYLQDQGSQVLVLVWFQPGMSDSIRMALQAIAPDAVTLLKSGQENAEPVTVNGQPAYWVTGKHILMTANGQYVSTRLVEGPVLVWMVGEITYRLESNLLLEEAIKVAESLR